MRLAPLYASTGLPISPAPTPGLRTQYGFALHVATEAVLPGSYDMTFRYPLPVEPESPKRLDIRATPCTSASTSTLMSRYRRIAPLRTSAVLHPNAHTSPGCRHLRACGRRTAPRPTPQTMHTRITAAMAWSTLSTSRAPTGGGTDAPRSYLVQFDLPAPTIARRDHPSRDPCGACMGALHLPRRESR